MQREREKAEAEEEKKTRRKKWAGKCGFVIFRGWCESTKGCMGQGLYLRFCGVLCGDG